MKTVLQPAFITSIRSHYDLGNCYIRKKKSRSSKILKENEFAPEINRVAHKRVSQVLVKPMKDSA